MIYFIIAISTLIFILWIDLIISTIKERKKEREFDKLMHEEIERCLMEEENKHTIKMEELEKM